MLQDYEQTIVETTCVYEVNIDNDELVPVEAAWGCPPKYEHLHANKVLVFDFGSEVYVYNGKNAPFETRKTSGESSHLKVKMVNSAVFLECKEQTVILG